VFSCPYMSPMARSLASMVHKRPGAAWLKSATDDELHELIAAAEAELARRAEPPETPASRSTVEEVKTTHGCYRSELVRCGKSYCRCKAGPVHGPYWYWYGRVDGRSVSRYVGEKRPVLADQLDAEPDQLGPTD
jgi:Family of unknown function (DUF6788)